MGDTRELIQKLYTDRRTVVEQQRALVIDMEAQAEGATAEQDEQYERMDSDIRSLGKRIDQLLNIAEQAKEADAQRERFEQVLQVSGGDGAKVIEDFAARIRTWMMAGLPDAEVWAPRGLTIQLGDVGLRGAETHDLTKGTATAGAELIPVSFVQTLYQHMVELAAVRQTNAQVFRTTSGENLLVPKTTGFGTATLIAEGGAVLENDPAFGQVTLNAYKYGQLIQVSTELLQDSAVDLIGFLARAAGLNIGQASGVHFVTGTGTAQPQGIANAPVAGKTGATGQTLTVIPEDLIDLFHSIVSGYRVNAYWVMNDLSAAIIRKIRDASGASATTGNFIWQPGLQAGDPDRILGKPVVLDPNMAVMAANAFSIAFGDFSLFYAIRDVNTVRFERSDDFAFGNDLVSFRCLFRTDGKQLVNGSGGAVKFYRNSAT